MSQLIIPVSDKSAKTPYSFVVTGINVYSFEEALYHVYHYWRESSEDIVSPKFISWLAVDAGLSYLAEKVARISIISSYTKMIISFLTLTDYFSDEDICLIKTDISNWERDFEWENLKLRADFLLEQNMPDRAVILYKRANELFKSAELLNNTGIAFVRLYKFDTAVSYFEDALDLGLDSYNVDIMLNLAEAAIYAHDFTKASEMLSQVEEICNNNPLVFYLHGEMDFENGRLNEAVNWFLKAFELTESHKSSYAAHLPHFACRLADVYAQQFAFERALSCLEKVVPMDKRCYIKYAEISASSYKLPNAINAIERAIKIDGEDFSLYVNLAKYCRLNHDNSRARVAIKKAIQLAPDSGLVKLEHARINKIDGGINGYLSDLNVILDDFKREYRKAAEL
ncbi:MAG: hypothetical protein FWE29_02595 [Defluviitaleaceae bacterium]|nr:hypothetical protein [Defluviitaleaceae bacterium]